MPSDSTSQTHTSITSALTDADNWAYRDLLNLFPRYWHARYHHRTTRNGIIDFQDRPWLKPIYLDTAHAFVIKKCSQVGISEFLIASAFNHARQGLAGGYILPTKELVYSFTPRRIDKLIMRVPLYRANCRQSAKHSDTKTQKTIFGTDWNFIGSNVIVDFYEKPLDVLMVDELDKCNRDNLEFAKDRTGSAMEEFSYKAGNPTFAGTGIDAEYRLSDEKTWMIKCEHCGEWQGLSWFANVVRMTEAGVYEPIGNLKETDHGADLPVCCAKCGKPVNRLQAGQWIAAHPDRPISGYAINKVFADARPGQRMLALYREFLKAESNHTATQRFWNNVLGITYDAAGKFISREMLAKCAGAHRMGDSARDCVGGCDVGAKLHVHISRLIGNQRIKMFIGSVHTWDDLHDLSAQFGVTCGVVDARPETHKAREFVQAHPEWWLCDYRKQDVILDKDPEPVDQMVQVDRTQSLDESMAQYAKGQVLLPTDWETLDGGDFVSQMTVVKRVWDDEKKRYAWKAGENDNMPDHHRHADNYEAIAARLHRQAPEIIVLGGDS